jgi:hypothetical protein
VGRGRVVEAYSILWSVDSLLLIIGPGIGGALLAAVDAGPALALDSLSYLISAVLIASIAGRFQLDRAEPVSGSMRQSIREGISFLWAHPTMRALTLAGIGNSFTGGAVVGLTVVYAVRQLSVPADSGRIGIIFSVGAVGSLAASLALPRLTARFQIPRLTLVSLGLSWVVVVILSRVTAFWAGCLAYAAFEAGSSLTILNGIAYRQTETPDHLQSRVNSVARMIAWGGFPLGGALGGWLASWMPVGDALLVMGLGLLASFIYGLSGPLRRPAIVASSI